MVPFYRNVYSVVPRGKAREVALMLKAIHSREDLKAAREKAEAVVEKLEAMKLRKAATIVKDGCEETLSYFHFPSEHWKRLRTNNALEPSQQGDSSPDQGRRELSRWGIGPDARLGPSQAYGLRQVGQTNLPEHGMLAGTGPGTTAGIRCDLKKSRHSPSGACCLKNESAKNTGQNRKQ